MNSVDWSNHGCTADVQVVALQNLVGNDVDVQFMDKKFYETDTGYYHIGSGTFSLDYDGFEDGDFAAVLEEAGVTDERA